MKIERATPKEVAQFILGLGDEQLDALVKKGNLARVKTFADGLIVERKDTMFFTVLEDTEVSKACQPYVSGWRNFAGSLGWNGHIAYRVRRGYTLKAHAPKSGACYQDWAHLQSWELKGDQPTEDATAFWIPRLVSESTDKNVKEQLSLLADLRKKFALPKHHLSTFGSAALLSGLMLAHHQRTGERVPLSGYWTRTDTLLADGGRLSLGNFGECGLFCDSWGWDECRGGFLGCFPPGVELGR